VPIDDPGWGDYVPVSEEKPAGAQPPAAGARPPRRMAVPGGLWAIGIAILAVIVAVGVVLKLTSGSSKPAASGTSTTTGTTTATTKAKTKTAPPGTISKAAYLARADAVCSAYQARLTAASDAQNFPLIATLLGQLIQKIEKIPEPDQDAATANKALADAQNALLALDQGNSAAFLTQASAADTLWTLMGSKSCGGP
jgi:hypothetical protein